jgi:CheY-like chemotaxis protein
LSPRQTELTDGVVESGEQLTRLLGGILDLARADPLRAKLDIAPVDLRALDLWRAEAFDLILMDVNMPVLGGREAVREIRRAEPAGTRLPSWMLTANVFPEDVARYWEDGADGVLRKPLDVAALYALLADVAQRRVAEV